MNKVRSKWSCEIKRQFYIHIDKKHMKVNKKVRNYREINEREIIGTKGDSD